MGKLMFLVLRDRTATCSSFCSEATLGDELALLDEVDLGDIIGATGRVGTTRKGELSLIRASAGRC